MRELFGTHGPTLLDLAADPHDPAARAASLQQAIADARRLSEELASLSS